MEKNNFFLVAFLLTANLVGKLVVPMNNAKLVNNSKANSKANQF